MASNPACDLLNVPNDLFYVIFDTGTPRPHFIIKSKKTEDIKSDFGEMKPEKTQKLMEAVQSMMSSYEITSGILSIHRGSWFSTKAKAFHAHICVDFKPYLDVFEREKSKIPNWPNKKYVSKEWRANDDPGSYPENVLGYPYKHYFNDEVAIIKKNLTTTPLEELPSVDVPGIKQVMHPKYPMIGFVGKRNEVEPENLLRVIEEFAQKLGLTNLKNKDEIYGGCHVCLYLGKGKLIFDSK